MNVIILGHDDHSAEGKLVDVVLEIVIFSDTSDEQIRAAIAQLKALINEEEPEPGTGTKPGIGKFAEALIKKGYRNKDVLAAVKQYFPGCKTTYACIAWYRNKLKQEGML